VNRTSAITPQPGRLITKKRYKQNYAAAKKTARLTNQTQCGSNQQEQPEHKQDIRHSQGCKEFPLPVALSGSLLS
jgi:hypothetical protein